MSIIIWKIFILNPMIYGCNYNSKSNKSNAQSILNIKHISLRYILLVFKAYSVVWSRVFQSWPQVKQFFFKGPIVAFLKIWL